MEGPLRSYRPRLIRDDDGHNFWVADGKSWYRRPGRPGALNPGTGAPPGGKIQKQRRASPGSQTLSNIKERLTDLDKEKIDVQIIYPSFLLHVNMWEDGMLANAVCHAYNSWLAKVCSEAPDRLKGVGVVSLQDPQGASKEVSHIKDLGLAAVMINGTVGAKRIDHPDHEPFYSEADRLRVPIAIHFSLEFPGVSDLFPTLFPGRILAGLFPVLAGFTSVLCSGMMDRYPHAHFAFLEGGSSWVPAYVERMDEHFENPRYHAKEHIQKPPSEYLHSGRIFFGCEGDEKSLGRVVQEIGEEKLMYSSDYPHADRSEGTVNVLKARCDLSSSAKQRILEDNARRFYGF